jgi:hypothetical protein
MLVTVMIPLVTPTNSFAQILVHHQRIHKPIPRMPECSRQAPDNFKAQAEPELDGVLVRADYEIKLHGAKPTLLRMLERMQAHRPPYPAALRCLCRHITAIRNVRSAPALISPQEVRPDYHTTFFEHERFMSRCKPKLECRDSAHVTRKRVRLAAADHRLEDRPDRLLVLFRRYPNRQTELPLLQSDQFLEFGF